MTFDDVADAITLAVDDEACETMPSNVTTSVHDNSLDKSANHPSESVLEPDQFITTNHPESDDKHPSSRVSKNLSSNIIGSLEASVTTRRKDKVNYLEMISNVCFTSSIEPKNVKEAL